MHAPTPINRGSFGTHGRVQRMLVWRDMDPRYQDVAGWLLTSSCLDAPGSMPAGSVRCGLGRPYLTCTYREEL